MEVKLTSALTAYKTRLLSVAKWKNCRALTALPDMVIDGAVTISVRWLHLKGLLTTCGGLMPKFGHGAAAHHLYKNNLLCSVPLPYRSVFSDAAPARNLRGNFDIPPRSQNLSITGSSSSSVSLQVPLPRGSERERRKEKEKLTVDIMAVPRVACRTVSGGCR